jgi:stearoyl-CoA desaturase (delta-9 desaturase)
LIYRPAPGAAHDVGLSDRSARFVDRPDFAIALRQIANAPLTPLVPRCGIQSAFFARALCLASPSPYPASQHPMTAESRPFKISPWAIPFIVFQFSPLLVAFVGFSWEGVAICLASYAIRMFGVTAGYHRYFSHRSFQTSRAFQFVLAFLAESSIQKGVIWWAANHRHHHWNSDRETDIHSPARHGFLYSHVGWIVSNDWDKTDVRSVRDLTKYPELVWLDRWYWVPGVVWAVLLTAAFGMTGLVWGFFVSTVLLWHGTFFINSLCHVLGKRVYATTDTSKNSFILAVITLGEGWHNNHHYFQRSAAQGWRWYELDVTYYTLRLLQLVGVVRGVGKPPRHVIEQTIDRGVIAAHDAPAALTANTVLASIQERVDALGDAARQLATRAEGLRADMQRIGERTMESFQERADQLHESAARLQGRAEALLGEIRQSRDRTLDALHDHVEAIGESAQAVIEQSRQTASAPTVG